MRILPSPIALFAMGEGLGMRVYNIARATLKTLTPAPLPQKSTVGEGRKARGAGWFVIVY